MIGWDFSLFWEVGKAILAGTNPYAVDSYWYPPAASLSFVLFGLLPFSAAYLFWTVFNLFLYFHTLWRMKLGRYWWGWLLFTPFLFIMLSGQLDIFFLWAASFLIIPPKRNRTIEEWGPVLAGVMLTLKPQLAAVVLPWFIVRWWLYDRRLLLRWSALTALIHLIPLIYKPDFYSLWLTALQGVGFQKSMNGGGLFAFLALGVPDVLIWISSGCLMIWGLFQKEAVSRTAQLTGSPICWWYDMLFLIGNAPVWFMVPLSWLALSVSYLVHHNLPMVIIPFGSLIWGIFQRSKTEVMKIEESPMKVS
jgi:hypothetical protein